MISTPHKLGISLYMLPAMLAEVFSLGKTDTAVLLKQGRFATGEHSEESAKIFKSDSQFMRKLKQGTLKNSDLDKPIKLMAKRFELDESRLLELAGDSDIRSAYDSLNPWLTGYNEALTKKGEECDPWLMHWVNYLNQMFAEEREKLDEIEAQTDIETKNTLASKHMNNFLGFDLSSVSSKAGQDYLMRCAVVMNLAAIVEVIFVSSIHELNEAKPIFSEFLPTVSKSKNKLPKLVLTNKKLIKWLFIRWRKAKAESKKKPTMEDFLKFLALKDDPDADRVDPDTGIIVQRINRWKRGDNYINFNHYHAMFSSVFGSEGLNVSLNIVCFVTVLNLITLTQLKAKEYGLSPEFVVDVYSNYQEFYNYVRDDFIAMVSKADS